MAQPLRVTSAAYARIHGWLEPAEADLIRRHAASPWCEVGAWKGRATVVLAERGPGYVVDWFRGSPEHPPDTDTFDEFQRNTRGLPITVIRSRFEDAVDRVPGGLRFLYLDADHSYHATRLAFDLYAPKLAGHGTVCLHDAVEGGWPGVERVCRELEREGWAMVDMAGRSAAYQRR